MAQQASASIAYFQATGFPQTEVETCYYQLNRPIDQKGRPAGVTQGGTITVELVSNKDTSPLAEWITDPFKEGDGSIEFYDAVRQQVKMVQFNNARCVGYSERFDRIPNPMTPNRPAMTMTLTISAEKIMIGDAEHDNNWGDKM